MRVATLRHGGSAFFRGTRTDHTMATYSLPREHRLTRRPDFKNCYEAGRRYFSRYFVLFAHRRADDSPAWRIGLAVTKKTGNAVIRNRVKRVLREFFRLHGSVMPGYVDVVVVPKRQLDPSRVTLAFVTSELEPLVRGLLPGRSVGHGAS